MSVKISENLFYVRISETFCWLNGTGISTPVHEPCSFHAWNTKLMLIRHFGKMNTTTTGCPKFSR